MHRKTSVSVVGAAYKEEMALQMCRQFAPGRTPVLGDDAFIGRGACHREGVSPCLLDGSRGG